MATNDALFRQVAPALMRRFMKDFNVSALDSAAVFGNAGHESGGFRLLQEVKPAVAGSAGGYGWFQWTGMGPTGRRRLYMNWCKEHGLDPKSHEANYGFLCHELRTSERQAMVRLREAKTLDEKVIAFERAYERAGVKHYPSRQAWARIALGALGATPPPPDVEPVRPKTKVPEVVKDVGKVIVGTGGAAEAARQSGLSWSAIIAVALVAAVIGISLVLWRRK